MDIIIADGFNLSHKFFGNNSSCLQFPLPISLYTSTFLAMYHVIYLREDSAVFKPFSPAVPV